MARAFDVSDYLQEFDELTDLGMSCREIIERSAPSLLWYRKHVFPVTPKALCGVCRGYFRPAGITRGMECGSMCHSVYTGCGRAAVALK